MQIYLARNKVQAGPYTLDQLNKMLSSGQIDLNDLIWHEGMSEWQRVGTVTGETYHYDPNTSTSTSSENKKLTVAELYGKKDTIKSDYDKQAEKMPFTVNKSATTPMSVQQVKKIIAKANDFELAPISTRIIASLIDQILAMLCLVPLVSGLDIGIEQLRQVSEDPTILAGYIEAAPQHLLIMTTFMVVSLLIVQIIMLTRRGQSIGKLVMGVRILDFTSKKIPSITNIVLLRTIVTNLAYNIPTIGIFVLLADVFMLFSNKNRRSLHDKLAKTFVVKASPHQLDKN